MIAANMCSNFGGKWDSPPLLQPLPDFLSNFTSSQLAFIILIT